MNRTNCFKTMFVILVFSVFCTIPQNAAAISQSCEEDAKRYCSGLEKGDPRIANCLMRQERKLDTTCKQSLEDEAMNIGESIVQCEADSKKFCQSVTPGGGRVVECLKKNKSKLSAACTAHIKA